ncbi:MAG TPA: nucleotide sugar dehydrogenase [Candidatus Angelobacter sp.]|nr:nucleotide sugar dehydrogenase [Candidatus Angelobacter sp.]
MTQPSVAKAPNRKLERKTAVDLTVVGGAGHVGIPLVLSFASKGLRVMIHDVNERALDQLRSGIIPFIEHGAKQLLQRALEEDRLVFSSRDSELPRSGPLIITIGTPVDEFLNPSLKVIKACIDALLPYIEDGQLLVLRSTVYPGTTDWLAGYLKQRGRDIPVAFCPERIIQGYGIRELSTMPQIIGGFTPEAEEAAAALFGLITPEIVRVKPIEAEFAKVFSNAYRYIEFATTNQFYMIARSAGADYNAILNAMKRNYPRAAKIPGAGFAAGPCLFKDTMQLAAFARNQFALGHAAMLVNEGLVLYVVDEMRRLFDLSQLTVGLLGMAFKPEVDDIRSSLSYKLKRTLMMHAREVLTSDPFVQCDPDLKPLHEVVERSDVLILATPHSAYKELDLRGKPVFDVWGFFDGTVNVL